MKTSLGRNMLKIVPSDDIVVFAVPAVLNLKTHMCCEYTSM